MNTKDRVVWSNFGRLDRVWMEGNNCFISGDIGTRKMSSRYKSQVIATYIKAKGMIGCKVSICTAQNTAKWDPRVWFRDLKKTGEYTPF